MEGVADLPTAAANEVFFINLTRPSSGQRVLASPFNPAFTYSIFEEELIIGYKEPRILLNLRANDLKPTVKVEYKKKLESWNGVTLADLPVLQDKETDIETLLSNHLPSAAFDDATGNAPADGPDPTSKSWKPPGRLMNSFKHNGKAYEVWGMSMTDPAALEIFRNAQILVPLFIEGGSIAELDEDWTVERWSLFVLYEVTPLEDWSESPYTVAGFCTSYRYWVFPTFDIVRATKSLPSPPSSANGAAKTYSPPRLTQDPETHLFNEHVGALELPSRERISQFVILPQYQGQTLGGKLYDTIFDELINTPNIYEIPVEDPNESFDVMRDYSDLVYLRKLPAFQKLSIPSTIPPELLKKDAPIPRDLILGNGTDLETLRHETKIVPRQFNRALEIHLLSTIPPLHRNPARITRKERASSENDRRYYFWRLALKDRIYRQNADILDQLEDPAERVDRLEQSVDSVQEEYSERLEGLEKRELRATSSNGAAHAGSSRSKRKRAIVDDEDEEDDEAAEADEDDDMESVHSSKKVKA